MERGARLENATSAAPVASAASGGIEPAARDADVDQAAPREGLSFIASAQRRLGGWSDGGTTPLTAKARALYEGGVVPVRAIARLCGVSVRTLYHHAHKRGWTMRNAAPVKGGARERDRRRAQRNALLPKAPGGLLSRGARDPQREANAHARARHAQTLADEAYAQAIARRASEAELRVLSALVQALALLDGARKPGRRRSRRPRTLPSARLRDASRQDMLADLARRMDAAVAAQRE
jgi:hypothetical protein